MSGRSPSAGPSSGASSAPSLPPAGAPATCMLVIGDRIIVGASAPPDAEYALFDSGDIELRASELGRVREHGYQTTVHDARVRLAQAGVTSALARECAAAMQPALSEAYARGAAVRRVARYLGPAELFQSNAFDAATHTYSGVFLDLPALVSDLAVDGTGPALQALFLAALLETEAADTAVFLSTDAWTKLHKPGYRTHKRPNLAAVRELATHLRAHARTAPQPIVREHLPLADVTAFLRACRDRAPDEDSRALYASLERAICARDMPDKGPLADPALWALERRFETDDLYGIVEALEALERTHGRTPGTTYLRARTALALRLEPAKLVAERVSALALSMTSFEELSLLAAEAWLEAGEPRRAMPYARDLVDATAIDEALRLRAQRLLARAVRAAPDAHATQADAIPAAAMSASSRPQPPLAPVSPPDPDTAPESFRPAKSRVPTTRGTEVPTEPGFSGPWRPEERAPGEGSQRPGKSVLPTQAPPPLELGAQHDPTASFTLELPAPEPFVEEAAPERTSRPPPLRRRTSGVMVEKRESRSPRTVDPRAEPDEPIASARAEARISDKPTLKDPDPEARAKRHTSPVPADASAPTLPRLPSEAPAPRALHGASLPPYALEDPPPRLSRAPLLPKLGGAADELAEHLALPPGIAVSARVLEGLPQSVLDARVRFTLLARELGRDYRVGRQIELRADVSGIEAMQSVLLERFADHVVRTTAELHELYRHGALLSEILARRLDGEWIDISPNEVGFWAMLIPPDTRVWPFGRVARLVQMGHKERDLVSYFLELQGRARGR